MKTFLRSMLALALLLLLPRFAAAGEGVHGMALFGGRDGLYASHLPMFHPPHDAQVVLRVRFADPALERTMRRRLEGRTALWTLDPERFDLARLAPAAAAPLQAFRADLVEGHFERGGALRVKRADLIVDSVLLYRPLSPAAQVQAESHYLPVGPFLVKLIDSRPDFDHIVLLRHPAAGPVAVPKTGVRADLATLARRVETVGTVYYESGDLR
jgi:hypothetical protein